MRQAVVAFVESNTTGTGRLFCLSARARALRPVVLTQDPARYAYLATEGVEAVTVDTADRNAVLEVCRDRLGALAGVSSSSEYFVGTAAWVANRLGLPAPDAVAIERTRDKGAQRETLRASQVPSPAFRIVTTSAEALRAVRDIGVPVVVKPVRGSGSVGVRLCRDPGEAVAFAEYSLARRTNERGMPEPARLVIEQYIDGPEYSVEMFDGQIIGTTAKHLGPPPSFVEVGHDFPATLDPVSAAAIGDCATDAVQALGVGWGAAHVEIRLGPSGPMIIEVNPRLAGGMIPELVRAAYGVDLVDCVVARACGAQPKLGRVRKDHASIRFLLAPGDGEITAIDGVHGARATRGVRAVTVTAAAGDRIRLTRSFKDRIGSVVATGPTAALAAGRADAALRRLTVHMLNDGTRGEQ
ncbi:ATP-grasp domain-containing protein [Nocardia jiangsuensis]|uniref:ATP-grasp domain-containing protein n=1 Tax=Nocardia jiangsuensis TaxID=1691563 RepID=A0ABV8E0Y0_9NOCA